MRDIYKGVVKTSWL